MDPFLVAVTSLSQLPHHQKRQVTCLRSWRDFGLSIFAVNTTEEIQSLQTQYGSLVDNFITCDDIGTHMSRPTQTIKSLCGIAEQLGRTILLINSDIEIYGAQETLTEKIKDDTLTMGIRWNYDRDPAAASRFVWGIDAFTITPEFSRSLPDLPLQIGHAMWDYWLPLHAQQSNVEINAIGEPFFFHENHKQHWLESDWYTAAAWVSDHYHFPIRDYPESVVFRKSFPFPPS